MGDTLCIVQRNDLEGEWCWLTAWAALWAWTQDCICAMLRLHLEIIACMLWCVGVLWVWGHISLDQNQLWPWNLAYFGTPAELVLKCFSGAHKRDCVSQLQKSNGSATKLRRISLYIKLQTDKSVAEIFSDWKAWEACKFVQFFQPHLAYC